MNTQNQIAHVIDTLERLSERTPHLTAKAVQHVLHQVCSDLEAIHLGLEKNEDLAPQRTQLSRRQRGVDCTRSGEEKDLSARRPQPVRKPDEATHEDVATPKAQPFSSSAEAIPSGSSKRADLNTQRRNPEQELLKLRRGFGVISRRLDRALLFQWLRRKASVVVFLAAFAIIGVSVPFILMKTLSPWPLMTTARHIVAVPSCTAAKAVGLAPSRRGQPGYWRHLDSDGDGVACEPWA